jgi:hypothetical protein
MNVTLHETFNQNLKNHPGVHNIFSHLHMPSTNTPLFQSWTPKTNLSPTALLGLEFKRSNCYAAVISFHLIFFFSTRAFVDAAAPSNFQHFCACCAVPHSALLRIKDYPPMEDSPYLRNEPSNCCLEWGYSPETTDYEVASK